MKRVLYRVQLKVTVQIVQQQSAVPNKDITGYSSRSGQIVQQPSAVPVNDITVMRVQQFQLVTEGVQKPSVVPCDESTAIPVSNGGCTEAICCAL